MTIHPRNGNNDTELKLDSTALLARPEDFSLVFGGPL
jgi:hypothetical protein